MSIADTASPSRATETDNGAADERSLARTSLTAARRRLLVSALTVFAFAWRLSGLTEQGFWRDEIDVIYLALRPLGDTFSMFISPAQNGPLYYLLVRPWLFAAGSSEFALRYTSVMAGTVSVVLLWQVARRLLPGDGRTGLDNLPLLAVLLLAVNPYQIWYSQEGKMYALVMCTTLLSSWSWLQAMHYGGGGRWLRYLVVTTLSIYTHLLTALILPLHFLWFLLAWPLNKQRWQGYAGTLAGFTVPYLPLVWWQWHYLTSLDYNTGYPFTPFPEVVRSLLLGHARGAVSDVPQIVLAPLFFLALAGLLVGWLDMGSQERATPVGRGSLLFPINPALRMGLVASWLVLPVLLIHGVSLLKPIFVDRYVIWIGAAFVFYMALGIQVIYRSGGPIAAGLAALLLAYTLGFWGWAGWRQARVPNKVQLREAIQYVASHREPDELLILQIPHTHYAYRYYTSDFEGDPFAASDERLAPWMEGLWTQNDLEGEAARQDVDRIMRQRTESYQEIWVLLVEAGSWDPRGLMTRWLDENGRLLVRQPFHGIEARHYRLAH